MGGNDTSDRVGDRHSEIYSRAELYDIAFDFRDVPAECEVLSAIGKRWSGREPASFLELAAGPAAHAREMARRGLRAVAVDLNPGMVAYGKVLAAGDGLDLDYVETDMSAFSISDPVDLAAILMDSMTVLLDNQAVLSHFECVAGALAPGGVYVLEMQHPRDVFGVGKSAGTDWEMERDGTTVHTTWGLPTDDFDPITQIAEDTVTVAWKRGEEHGEITEVQPNRRYVVNELRALVTASGRFEIVDELGAVDLAVPFSNAKESWRYVPILRRIR